MKIERILIVTFLIAELALVFDIPFGEEALTIGCLILALGYLFLGYWIFERKENNPGVQYRVFAGIVIFLFAIGMLFRLKVWPGGRLILLFASFASIIYLCAFLISNLGNKARLKKGKPIIFRLLFCLTLASLLYFTSGRTILKFQYINNPERGEEIIKILEYRESMKRKETNH